MPSHAATSNRTHPGRWAGQQTDSDAAAYSRTAFYVAVILSTALLAIWIGAGMEPGPVGSKGHLAFGAIIFLSLGISWLVRRAIGAHVDETGDLEFSIESASARQVAAESALLVYRDMLQEAGIGWYRLDAEGHLVTATQATVDLLGYASVDQMREAYTGRIFPASEHRRAMLNALRAVGEVKGHTAAWPTAEGDILQVRDSARTIRDHEGTILYIEGFVAAETWSPGSDTRIKRLEADLVAARQELTRAYREPQPSAADLLYVAHMSHELRTPLNAIVGATSLLDAARMERSQRELVDTLRLASDNLISVVDNTLDFSRLESGALEFELAVVDSRNCIEDAIELVSQKASDQGLEIAYRMADDIPETFLGDAHRVRQVLSNLLSNAVRFTPRGEIMVRLEAAPEADGKYSFHFSVRDTGVGITVDRQKRLFEPYYQGDAGTARRFGGSGLGLAISRMLVERMGGRIWVESEPGAGSTFHFTVLARPAEDPGRADSRSLAGLRALLLDDHSSSRATLTALLESLRISVNATNRTDLTADLLRGESTFDFVVISLESAVNSVAFASQLRTQQIAANLPIVLVAPAGSHAGAPAITRCVRILKPVRRSRIVDALLQVMGAPARETMVLHGGPSENSHLSVLVAEDDVVNGRVISKMIERLGHHVTLVDRGDAVGSAVAQNRFDLMILDVRMPGMTGPEAARDVRNRLGASGQVPRMIGMTASSDPSEQKQCLDAGMETCLLKPITPQVLADQLSRTEIAVARNETERFAVKTDEPDLTHGRWIDETDEDSSVFEKPAEPSRPVPPVAIPPVQAVDPIVASVRRAAGARYRNDRAAIAGALSSFERSAISLLKEMTVSLEAGQFEKVAEAAARMKEESNAMGLSRIAALCKALEATGKGNPRPGAVGPFVRAIQAAFEEARPMLKAERARLERTPEPQP